MCKLRSISVVVAILLDRIIRSLPSSGICVWRSLPHSSLQLRARKRPFSTGLQSVNRLYHNNKLVSRYIICSITQSTVTEIKINLNPFKTLKLQCKFTIYLLKKYLVTTAIDNKIFEFNKERKH
jgi:hypothetical protein